MGQILSDEGNQEEAINYLIDSLKWDSKNTWALVMMGNIFAKFKDDIPTAMKYYDQALLINPDDNITINNIGANLLNQGKIDIAEKYFWRALDIDNQYPNTHYALGLIAEMKNDLNSSFYSTIQSIKLNKNQDVLFQNSFKLAYETANKLIKENTGKRIFREFRSVLEKECNKEISIIEDNAIPTAAKIEFAENYNRNEHIVKYNTKYTAVEHLIMHELVHLQFVIEARNVGVNKLVISTQDNKKEFLKQIESNLNRMQKMGFAEDSIISYSDGLFEGINRQTYNTPIDLFIEDLLFNEYPELRPFQFISLMSLINEGINAVTNKKYIDLVPRSILSCSKIYNLVNAYQFKDIYGIDLIREFKALPFELKLAKDFYEEFLNLKDQRKAGEEYNLVLKWASKLNLTDYFELISESDFFTPKSNVESILRNIENDPFGITEKDPFKETEMEKFRTSQAEIGTNMAVVMFMVDALNYFENKTNQEIKEIAFEIAMLGTQGYKPDKEDYRLKKIPGKLFSGYHILAYYYVSWAIAIPEMLSQLQLPYDDEYNFALQIFKPNQDERNPRDN